MRVVLSAAPSRSIAVAVKFTVAARNAAAQAKTLNAVHRALSLGRRRHVARSGSGAGPTTSANSAIQTDETVPESHRGLHSMLYGEGGATDAHGSGSGQPYLFREVSRGVGAARGERLSSDMPNAVTRPQKAGCCAAALNLCYIV